ncbi:hypothetical protein BTO18_06655 [Polaribacter porphyrae]|uniref:Uncharacterized protein n=1 Tax=Polaribacter porphyrae TaxID=1137780 RepID=A0A2S7WMS0_9FLAO|nr:hypothetical protein BTO18_06655 [Polaribacter porphyrae]
MSTTTFKSINNTKKVQNEIVIQITKKQLINFFRSILVFALVSINFLAISINSPFLKDLFIAEIILLLIFFIKTNKSNTILK